MPGEDGQAGSGRPGGQDLKSEVGDETGRLGADRPIRIAVIGAGDATPDDLAVAREVGRLLARAGAVVVSGGGGGVMEAASRGSAELGGWTVGILSGSNPSGANAWVRLPLPTGFGQGRNVLVVQAGEAVLAVGGRWGTLSEIALARKLGREVGLLGPPPAGELDLPTFSSTAEAVDWAIERARELRSRG